MPTRIHYQTELQIEITNLENIDLKVISSQLIYDKLKKVWHETYLADLDVEDYIDIVADIWLKYHILSSTTKEAINKIKDARPPSNLKIYLTFNLFDDQDNLKLDISEVDTVPLFRAYLSILSTKDLWDTYVYDTKTKKFESLEIIEPAYLEEMKLGLSDQEKINLDELILQSYGFHNRLLSILPKKILLYTAQPPDKISEWNKKGIIPKGTYFTDKLSRSEYYWEKGDIIVDYRIPEDAMVMTSDFGGAKEYVTVSDVIIT